MDFHFRFRFRHKLGTKVFFWSFNGTCEWAWFAARVLRWFGWLTLVDNVRNRKVSRDFRNFIIIYIYVFSLVILLDHIFLLVTILTYSRLQSLQLFLVPRKYLCSHLILQFDAFWAPSINELCFPKVRWNGFAVDSLIYLGLSEILI